MISSFFAEDFSVFSSSSTPSWNRISLTERSDEQLRIDIRALVDELTRSHRLFEDKLIPEIDSLFEAARYSLSLAYGRALFHHIVADLSEHFGLEEYGLFAYAISLSQEKRTNSIGECVLWEQFALHHDAPEKEIEILINGMKKACPEWSSNLSTRMLIAKLEYLQAKLEEHALQEDGFLIPAIKRLELARNSA